MSEESRSIKILMADDDPEDCLLVQEALSDNQVIDNLHFVYDGEELMDYLHQRGKYLQPDSSPRPGLILLDLNMPRKDGWEALQEIKADPHLQSIPVVILTTSNAREHIIRAHNLGANSFIRKPVTFSGLVEVMKALKQYWFEIVELPLDNMDD